MTTDAGGQRRAILERKTGETRVRVVLALDGTGQNLIRTPVPFLSHMLSQIARHGGFDLEVDAEGDTHIDDHHSVEDIGLVLGAAFRQALGDRAGIERFADRKAPLDEALVDVTIDLSGRPYLVFGLELPKAKVGTFDVELVKEFYQAFAVKAECNVHVRQLSGQNLHHIIEASFKAFALALRDASRVTRQSGLVRSTKDHLD
ncbi:MAG: imidazoleglycerol-phosphate dehydratase HisB [Myxococcales bacterium]|nr:imidazoleglycerol-phosphate dehydratase HisB [Myxococcales bacterium]